MKSDNVIYIDPCILIALLTFLFRELHSKDFVFGLLRIDDKYLFNYSHSLTYLVVIACSVEGMRLAFEKPF